MPFRSSMHSVGLGLREDFSGLQQITRGPRSRWWGALIARLVLGLIGLAVVQVVRTEYPHGLPAGPLGRAQLVARANSICSAADARIAAFRPSASATAIDGSAVELAVNEMAQAIHSETNQLRELRPTAEVAAEWRVVMAGLIAHDHFLDAVGSTSVVKLEAAGRALEIAAHKGDAAERRLGISCSTYSA